MVKLCVCALVYFHCNLLHIQTKRKVEIYAKKVSLTVAEIHIEIRNKDNKSPAKKSNHSFSGPRDFWQNRQHQPECRSNGIRCSWSDCDSSGRD